MDSERLEMASVKVLSGLGGMSTLNESTNDASLGFGKEGDEDTEKGMRNRARRR